MMALEGLKVLDLSRLAPGPFCSMLLSDMGADVLRIDAPRESRVVTGLSGLAPKDVERNIAYDALGRNKRSIILNLKHEESRAIFYRLAETADVVLEEFRPGVASRLKVDYETLRKYNPSLVYCSVSGYGQTGPNLAEAGHDINYISIGGLLGMIGWPGERPAIPVNIADFAAGGLHAAYGILLALLARERTGCGQYVDIGMTDGVLYLLAWAASEFFREGVNIEPGNHMINGSAPYYNVYACKDGRWISVGAVESHFFANLCRVLNCERFIPHQYDPSHWPELAGYLREQFVTRTRDEWCDVLRSADACVTPVYSLGEAFADTHNLARSMVQRIEHPTLGSIKQVGIGTKLSETPGAIRSTGPLPGEHTDDVLISLGFNDRQISELRRSGGVE